MNKIFLNTDFKNLFNKFRYSFLIIPILFFIFSCSESNICNPKCNEWEICKLDSCILKDDSCYNDLNCSEREKCDKETHKCIDDSCIDECNPNLFIPQCDGYNKILESCELINNCYVIKSKECNKDQQCVISNLSPICTDYCTDNCDPTNYPKCSDDGLCILSCDKSYLGCFLEKRNCCVSRECITVDNKPKCTNN